MKWSDGYVDILGIQIPKERNDLTPINVYRKLAKIDKILLPWKGKYLSICGKITLINSLVISQFTNLLMVLPTPSDLFSMSKKYDFLFGMASQTKLKGRIYIMNMNSKGRND